MSMPWNDAVRNFTAMESGIRPSFVPMSSPRFPENLRQRQSVICTPAKGHRCIHEQCSPLLLECEQPWVLERLPDPVSIITREISVSVCWPLQSRSGWLRAWHHLRDLLTLDLLTLARSASPGCLPGCP